MPNRARSLLKRAAWGALVKTARPYLRLHLWNYNRTMRRGVFPEQKMERDLPGPDPERVLFVGDIAVAGYGVLLDAMAFPAQVAEIFSTLHKRGCAWQQIAAFDLTAKKAATLIGGDASRIDVAVIALGIPDVLLVTGVHEWETDLTDIVTTIRDTAGDQCRIVLTGVPPMDKFQPMPTRLKNVLAFQLGRLDAATARVASSSHNIAFVPFPADGFASMHMRDAFSFRAMHHLWAAAVAPHLVPSTGVPPVPTVTAA